MGLFSDLFGSSNHSSSTSSTSNVSNTQLAGGNIGGPALYGSSGNTIVTTDQGTVQAATDVGVAALALGATALGSNTAVSIAGMDDALAANQSSLHLADSAIAANSDLAGQAVDKVQRFATSALDSNTYIAGKALDSESAAYNQSLSTFSSFAGDALQTIADRNQSALDTVTGIASQVSQSAQQTTDTTVQKIVIAMMLAIAAIAIFNRGGGVRL